MKKYDSIILILGALLSLIPVYTKLGWVYVCIVYPEFNLSEIIAVFDSQILFNLFTGRHWYSASLFALSCGLVAGILLLISLVYSLQNNGNKTLKTIKVILFVINVIFTGWVLFGLM